MTALVPRLGLVGLLVVLGATGCSEDSSPGETVPAIADRLDEVDAAIEAGELGKARKSVGALVAETAQAQVEGKISDEQADQILDAARDLVAELPEVRQR